MSALVPGVLLAGAAAALAPPPGPDPQAMDRDLIEVTVPQLQRYYAEHRYTVAQVVDWYLARIHRYDGIYRSVEQVFDEQARAAAARADAAPPGEPHGLLWGVPVVVKANTSVAGAVTTDGWEGYAIAGHELVAPRDATVVARLRAAGAIILGHTNMPDFAASDTTRSSTFGRTGNAYDVRFSPGGSSGGTVTAVSANFAVLGTGTDTANSIRMPSATSALVGVLPTRGLVSIAGIAPLDWLLDNAGPIARTVGDAAIALSVMAGEDRLDPATRGSAAQAQPGPYTRYLDAGALAGRRFGVPAFMLAAADGPGAQARDPALEPVPLLDLRTRSAFLQAVERLRVLGATVIIDDTVLAPEFLRAVAAIRTGAYVREGTDRFLAAFGPAQYHSAAEYERAVGAPLPELIAGRGSGAGKGSSGAADPAARASTPPRAAAPEQRRLESDPAAQTDVHAPRRRALALYLDTLARLHLDGYVYPAIHMPTVDETPRPEAGPSQGPHSATGWVNRLGVPAVVVVGGFYADGLPFGLEFSGRPFRDGDLLGYAYAWEQATHHRHPPVLIEPEPAAPGH